jgi:hypothetical protein
MKYGNPACSFTQELLMLHHALEDWPEFKGQDVPCCVCGQPAPLEDQLSFSYSQQASEEERPTIKAAIFCITCTTLRHNPLGRC